MSEPFIRFLYGCSDLWGNDIQTVYWSGFWDCILSICGNVVRGNNAADTVTPKHSFKLLTIVGGLFDGVPLKIRTLTIKAAHLRGLFRIQPHGKHSLRALLDKSSP
ncbi:Uncharacterised protein [Salmonella enterica subsp. enterica]|uniref:Uncharacterized protein n=3 Tax=Salmonella TaxID=590 RepID=A0A447PB84_SALET|nr:Uncharacterised protein [Salmonella enterica subsp. enterica]